MEEFYTRERFEKLTGIPYSPEAVEGYVRDIFREDVGINLTDETLAEYMKVKKTYHYAEKQEFELIYQKELARLERQERPEYLGKILSGENVPSKERSFERA